MKYHTNHLIVEAEQVSPGMYWSVSDGDKQHIITDELFQKLFTAGVPCSIRIDFIDIKQDGEDAVSMHATPLPSWSPDEIEQYNMLTPARQQQLQWFNEFLRAVRGEHG